MYGREEHEKQVESMIVKKMQNTPFYIAHYMRTFTRKSYTTKLAYLNFTLEFLTYLQTEYGYNINDVNIFSDIKPSLINGYLDYLSKLEKQTKNGKTIINGDSIQCRKFYAIKHFFKFLLNDEYITKNPCDTVEPPKVNDEINIIAMNEREISVFLNNVLTGVGTDRAKARQKKWKNRDYAIMTLALALGLRVASITEINVDDINFNTNTLMVTEKGNVTRTLKFSDNIKNILLTWLEDREDILGTTYCDALFISNQKSRITTKTIRELVDKYSVGIDKHITPHKLRSTCGTNVYTKTGDIYLTADVLGHRNIQNTRRYAKIVDEKRKLATQAMDAVLFK